MGLKFLNIQTILHGYLCLGHANNFPTAAAKQMVVKVIKSDGMINIYYTPITASELMLEFPKHLVCDSHSFFIGQKIPTLSPNDKLQLGNNYFLLPAHFFQSVLSFVTIASSFASFNNMATVGAATMTNVQAFDIKKAPSGLLQVRVSDAFVSKLMQQRKINQRDDQQQLTEGDDENIKSNKICSTTQLLKEYTQLVSCRPQWKPKLDTIKESKRKKLSSSSFGIKRRKKGHHHQPKNVQQKNHKLKQDNQHQQQHQKITTKTKTKNKTKAKR